MQEYRQLREKHSMLELCRNPELAANVTMQPIERFDLDAAIIFADILLPLPALGVPFHFAKGEGPVLETPVRSARDVDDLNVDGAEERLGFVYEAIRIVRGRLNPRIALIGFAGAPFTVASYMIEGGHSRHFAKTKLFMYEQPQAWHGLMQKLADMTVAYLRKQVEAGANLIQLFDSWVGCLGREDYAEYVAPYCRRIITDLKSCGVPMIHFGTGTASFLDLMHGAGADVLGVDWRVDLSEVWRWLGNETVLQGNLDPVALLASSSSVLRDRVDSIMQKASHRPHIFNLGHGILPETRPDVVEAVISQVRQWSQVA